MKLIRLAAPALLTCATLLASLAPTGAFALPNTTDTRMLSEPAVSANQLAFYTAYDIDNEQILLAHVRNIFALRRDLGVNHVASSNALAALGRCHINHIQITR